MWCMSWRPSQWNIKQAPRFLLFFQTLVKWFVTPCHVGGVFWQSSIVFNFLFCKHLTGGTVSLYLYQSPDLPKTFASEWKCHNYYRFLMSFWEGHCDVSLVQLIIFNVRITLEKLKILLLNLLFIIFLLLISIILFLLFIIIVFQFVQIIKTLTLVSGNPFSFNPLQCTMRKLRKFLIPIPHYNLRIMSG